MDLKTEWIELDSEGAPVQAYLSRPLAAGQAKLPAVLVIQEIWGPDAHIQDVTDRFATAGFIGLAVDLFSHGGRPEPLTAERIDEAKRFLDSIPPSAWGDEAQREEALAQQSPERADAISETFGALMTPDRPMDRYVADLRAGAAYLRSLPECSGSVSSVGFCLGGTLSGRLAAQESQLAAAVIFYGQALPPEMIGDVACPVLGLYGAEDSRVNAGLPAFEAAMRAEAKDFETVVYAATGHAFFNDTRPSYRAGSARDAWARTLWFLHERTGAAETVALGAGVGA